MAKRLSDMLMYLKKLTEQVPDSLHPFQNARLVGQCLLPSIPWFPMQYLENSSHIAHHSIPLSYVWWELL